MDELQRARDLACRRLEQHEREFEARAKAWAEKVDREIGQLVDLTFDGWVRLFTAMAERKLFYLQLYPSYRKRWFKEVVAWEPQFDSALPPVDLNTFISMEMLRKLIWRDFKICDDAPERYSTMLSRRLGSPFEVRWKGADIEIMISDSR